MAAVDPSKPIAAFLCGACGALMSELLVGEHFPNEHTLCAECGKRGQIWTPGTWRRYPA